MSQLFFFKLVSILTSCQTCNHFQPNRGFNFNFHCQHGIWYNLHFTMIILTRTKALLFFLMVAYFYIKVTVDVSECYDVSRRSNFFQLDFYLSPSQTSQRGLSECGLTVFRLRPCLITAGVLATTSTAAGPWLYKGVGWMKGSAEAALEPDSIHPAGVAAFLTVPFTQYHGQNTALSWRYTSGSAGQGIRSGARSLDGKNLEVQNRGGASLCR